MKKIIIISILLLFSSFPVYAGDSTFCDDDQNTWEYFESMTKEYPDDIPLQILHALKIGLCLKIDQNSINTTEAINLFNDMVDTLANRRGDEEDLGATEDL